jgi:hypothetical protein
MSVCPAAGAAKPVRFRQAVASLPGYDIQPMGR